MNRLVAFLRNDSAATAVEYAVMLALILLTAITAIASFGAASGGMWGNIDTQLQGHGF
jgi:Flp pilus assembly pilin Flp